MPDGSEPIDRAAALNHLGAMLFNQGQLEGARLHFLAALNVDPDHYMALQNLGAVLRHMMQYEAAASVARRSVALSDGNAYARGNLATSLLGLRKYSEAKRLLTGVLKDIPEAFGQWHNYGLLSYIVGDYKEALRALKRANELNPGVTQVESDLSLTLLSLGLIQEGLEQYECRWNMLKRTSVWELGIREWRGEDLCGKHILVHHEQGLGDTLQWSRFLPYLLAKGAKVTLVVPESLQRIMAQSFEQVTMISWNEETVIEPSLDPTAFDFHSPLLSVIRWCGVTKPEEIPSEPYLRAVRRQDIKLPNRKLRVGICWASGNHGPALMERRRVIPVTLFLPLTELRDTAVVSLQVGENVRDICDHGLEGLIYDTSFRINDFADTAEIIDCLDLVISVDSAVVHLAAAMGKPTIMLSPYTRCWRWWSNRSGWPWYNKMRVFHQSGDGSWVSAMERVIGTARGDLNTSIHE